MNLVTKFRKHPADLTIFPLVQNHFQHGTELVLGAKINPLGAGLAFGEGDTLSEFFEGFRRGNTCNLHEIFLFNAVPRMRQQIREIAIVGHENEPLAHAVESTNRKESLLAWHKVDHPRTAGRIKVCGHNSYRLMEHIDHAFWVGKPLAIDSDFLSPWIDSSAELGDDLTIDFHPAGCDQFLAAATAAESGGSKHFLQSFEPIVCCSTGPRKSGGVSCDSGAGMRSICCSGCRWPTARGDLQRLACRSRRAASHGSFCGTFAWAA